MKMEKIILNEERHVSLTVYTQGVGGEFGNIPKRPAILVLPGGGYVMCSDREADPVALAYLQAGYQVFVLRYSVGKHAAWPNPLEDYEQAMAMIRSHAEKWNLYQDKIAVIGFSAGGHLAACAATISENRPNAAILGYAITEGETAQRYLKDTPDTVKGVDEKTPPCFVFATRNDNIVPVKNTVHFIQALEEKGIMFESHIYAYGPHGFTVCNSSVTAPGTLICSRTARWVTDSIEWLKDVFGDFGNGQMSEPKCRTRINGNDDEYISVDCTFGYLMKNEKACEVLAPLMKTMQSNISKEYKGRTAAAEGNGMVGVADLMKLRSVLSYAKMPEKMIEQLDQQLREIPNIKQKKGGKR